LHGTAEKAMLIRQKGRSKCDEIVNVIEGKFSGEKPISQQKTYD
jgi:hypothetical protein